MSEFDNVLARALKRVDYSRLAEQATQSLEDQRAVRQGVEACAKGIRHKAQDIIVTKIEDPARGPEFDYRHEKLNITPEVVATALSHEPDRAFLLRRKIRDRGGFLEHYSDVGAGRIAETVRPGENDGGGWLMLEASGSLVKGGVPHPRIVGGDGHFFVPPDKQLFVPSVPLPIDQERHDVVFDEGLDALREILADPACAMLVSDICTVEEARGCGFASATEDTAIDRAKELNQERTHKLRYLVAAIAAVRGVLDSHGRMIGIEFKPSLLNMISLIMHVRRQAHEGLIMGIQRGRTVPTELPGGDKGEILLDWYTTAQPID